MPRTWFTSMTRPRHRPPQARDRAEGVAPPRAVLVERHDRHALEVDRAGAPGTWRGTPATRPSGTSRGTGASPGSTGGRAACSRWRGRSRRRAASARGRRGTGSRRAATGRRRAAACSLRTSTVVPNSTVAPTTIDLRAPGHARRPAPARPGRFRGTPARTPASTYSPSSVSVNRRRRHSTRPRPSPASSFRIAWLTADCVTCSFRAAAV